MTKKSFIEILFGKYFLEPYIGYIELRFIHKDSGKTFSKFVKYKDFFTDELKEEIDRLNETNHVYFGVNPRPLSKKKKQDNIKNIICLWVDIDGKDFENGKKEALLIIKSFPLKPTIIVDSGHGYHCYFILEKPIINITKEQRLEFKQILSGLINQLQGDRQAVNLDRVMRLPGTYNIKKEKKECKIVDVNNKFYNLDDFNQFKDKKYTEIEITRTFPVFGTKELLVTYNPKNSERENLKNVKKIVNKLEIDSKTKKRIITGHLLTDKLADKTRSGRDISILVSLIFYDYNYPTIRSIFFNPYCGCSDRIREKGHGAEDTLQWDVMRALQFVEERKGRLTPEQKEILQIKILPEKEDIKLKLIANFIVDDLLKKEDSKGFGFKNKDNNLFYYFHKESSLLMEVKESIDFHCMLRSIYGLQEKDMSEIKAAIITEIWDSGEKAEAHTFSYFDNENFILYISNHNNQIFRLDCDTIRQIDNGTDGIFFEFNPEFTPFDIDVNKLEAINYFELPKLSSEGKVLGFNWARFTNPKNPVYLKKFLIDRTSFAPEEEHGLSPEEQKILLTVYFYSLFFESIQREKPVVCFIGLKESGKSFIAESIGKILFGDAYQIRHMVTNARDFHTILGTNYLLVFDNLDQYIMPELLDIFCATATGAKIERRMLYTDREKVILKPKVFLIITSREAKFKRDDFVSRLLLFNTKKIKKVISRSYLFKTLNENRNKLMAELLINLNSIIKLLRVQKDYNPSGKSRIADFELFIKKIARGYEGLLLRAVSEKMTTVKDIFALEGDPLYEVLNYIVNEEREIIEPMSASQLHEKLLTKADIIRMKDYQQRYKSPVALGKRLKNIQSELNKVMEFKRLPVRSHVNLYSFQSHEVEKTEEKEEKVKKSAKKPSQNLNLDNDIDTRIAKIRKKLKKKKQNQNGGDGEDKMISL